MVIKQLKTLLGVLNFEICLRYQESLEIYIWFRTFSSEATILAIGTIAPNLSDYSPQNLATYKLDFA